MNIRRNKYAIVDVETTGFVANGTDRIVEIGVICLDDKFNELGRWETLVNPCRDVGPTHIHGITAGEVINAPTFEEVAGDLWQLLDNAITVAHNASFDIRFIASEYRRLGNEIDPWSGLCTMWAAKRNGLPGSLESCCSAVGIEHPSAHCALADAVATSRLFTLLSTKYKLELPEPINRPDLKAIGPTGESLSREDATMPVGIGSLDSTTSLKKNQHISSNASCDALPR